MYFNESKDDTNIDKEFKNNKTFDLNKYKKYFIIGGITFLLLLLVIIIAVSLKNKQSYYINLEGAEEMSIYQNATYNEPGYRAYDNRKNNLTDQVQYKANVDTSTIGSYTIVYTLYNVEKVRKINVVAAPSSPTKIHLTGDKNVYLKRGATFTDPGCTAVDTLDGDLTKKVKVYYKNGNEVDTSKQGTYYIIYSVVNSSGVTTSETRAVVVE